jgi:hypothetical protein
VGVDKRKPKRIGVQARTPFCCRVDGLQACTPTMRLGTAPLIVFVFFFFQEIFLFFFMQKKTHARRIPSWPASCTALPTRKTPSWLVRLYNNLVNQEDSLLASEVVQPCQPGGLPPGQRGFTTLSTRRESSWLKMLYNLVDQEDSLLAGVVVKNVKN